MEFLKAILGEEIYNPFIAKINEYNGDEANKEKQIKLVNLTEGGYVSKDKYTNLETDLTGKDAELEKANGLIEQLKKATGKDEGLQQQITDYETEIETLKAENAELRTESALKFALSEAGGVDIDYLIFKAKEKGEIKLGEDGKISGIEELISGLKTQVPTQFKSDQQKQIQENKLETGESDEGAEPKSLAEALKQQYGQKE